MATKLLECTDSVTFAIDIANFVLKYHLADAGVRFTDFDVDEASTTQSASAGKERELVVSGRTNREKPFQIRVKLVQHIEAGEWWSPVVATITPGEKADLGVSEYCDTYWLSEAEYAAYRRLGGKQAEHLVPPPSLKTSRSSD